MWGLIPDQTHDGVFGERALHILPYFFSLLFILHKFNILFMASVQALFSSGKLMDILR